MYFWLFVVILLGAIEVITADLITIWFIASAILALITSIFIDSFVIQFAVFVILGVLFMLIKKPFMKKTHIRSDVKTNIDRIIGMNGIVTEEISKNKIGEVKVDGKKWSATSDKKIKVGSTVKVLSIEGVKLRVIEEKEGDE